MANTISIIVASPPTKGIFGEALMGTVEIPVDKLRASLSDLGVKLKHATAGLLSETEGFLLKELEVGIEVSAEGGVSLIGTAKAGATASLKLKFARDK